MWLMTGLLATTGLGYFFGMFTLWPLIRWNCCRYNGAPLSVGDEVVVLLGPKKGQCALVEEMMAWQGGWKIARLAGVANDGDLAPALFEEYSLMRIGQR